MRVTPDELHRFMGEALAEAALAEAAGEVPVGAVVVHEGAVIARAHNETEHRRDASAHAEILAIQRAGQASGGWRLTECLLVVTLEPCTMCTGAIRLARIPVVAFGAYDPRAGACGSLYDLSIDERLGPPPRVIAEIRAAECAARLASFFAARR